MHAKVIDVGWLEIIIYFLILTLSRIYHKFTLCDIPERQLQIIATSFFLIYAPNHRREKIIGTRSNFEIYYENIIAREQRRTARDFAVYRR